MAVLMSLLLMVSSGPVVFSWRPGRDGPGWSCRSSSHTGTKIAHDEQAEKNWPFSNAERI